MNHRKKDSSVEAKKKHQEDIKMFGRKKKDKNQTREYVDGQELPRPELPTPLPPQSEAEPLQAQEVYDEGRSVGFQEGLIHSIRILQGNLQAHQDSLRARIQESQPPEPQAEIPPPPPKLTPRNGNYEIRKCSHCGADCEVHKKKKAYICDHCGEASI